MIAGRSAAAGTWLLAGVTGLCIAIVTGLFCFVGASALAPFWPCRVTEVHLRDGRVLLGEVVADNAQALVLRGSEFDRIGDGYLRVPIGRIASSGTPADAVMLELADGRRLFGRGDADSGIETALLAQAGTPSHPVESLRPNALDGFARLRSFAQRLGRFLTTSPNASNLAGGVLPALIGTVTLVLLMSVIVMPFGIATALYLHERRGLAVRVVRAAINTLAGVPSIVYGVLGLALFVHGIGGSLDQLIHPQRLPVPTFGSGGLIWAALTLALLTLPVVVVSIEEGLARIPTALRNGSLALGATREETLWHLLLPAARPAVLTGLVLAVARAAGAVAPLMLVGVVKLAPAPPIDATFPWLHPTRQFMHLGFAVYDAALASPDALRGIPRAYACAGLLVGIVVALNLSAIVLRNRLRERYRALET